MIRFRLKERLADHSYRLARRVTLDEVAKATGIHRATLSKIASPKPSVTSTDTLDKLCAFFGCSLGDLAEYTPDTSTAAAAQPGTVDTNS